MGKNREVDAWFANYDNAQKRAMQAVRQVILKADKRMTECIKWQTPTFVFNGNLASFNPRAKEHVSILFHTGATIPGEHKRLEGGGDTARYMKLKDIAEVRRAKPDLEAIVKAWCALREQPAKRSTTTKTVAKTVSKTKVATKKTPKKLAKTGPKPKVATKNAAKQRGK